MNAADPEGSMRLDRRTFLRLGATAALGVALPSRRLLAARLGERELGFYQTHTGERLRVVYWAEGHYVPDALEAIDHVLRDHRTDEVRAIDRRLLDLLHLLGGALETREPFHVISGYRSPATNAMLAAAHAGVSPRSLHLVGQAIDVRLPDRALAELRRAALGLRGGGVGYYPAADFLHVDVGRVRTW
jgi:uncharacterized protein YcbK (DUF882 family)